jgi:hypothetical protein
LTCGLLTLPQCHFLQLYTLYWLRSTALRLANNICRPILSEWGVALHCSRQAPPQALFVCGVAGLCPRARMLTMFDYCLAVSLFLKYLPKFWILPGRRNCVRLKMQFTLSLPLWNASWRLRVVELGHLYYS